MPWKSITRNAAWLVAGLAAGLLLAHLPAAAARTAAAKTSDPAHRRFMVSLDEVRSNLVFAEPFTGRFQTTVTLSDGSRHRIALTPMLREGAPVVALADNGSVRYLDINGSTTQGALMVQVWSLDPALPARGEPAAR